jgi:hypothetical protein
MNQKKKFRDNHKNLINGKKEAKALKSQTSLIKEEEKNI